MTTDDTEDLPLDEAEAASGAAAAGEAVDETLDERVEAVVEELGGIERHRNGVGVTYASSGRAFAVLGEERLEVALDPSVAKVALRTPDTTASARGAGWIAFAPTSLDRFALDRAEAWVRSAHRRAASGS